MNKEKLSAILSLINTRVARLLMGKKGISNKDAAILLYRSEVYAMLENEESKLWHLSAETIFSLLEEELTSGTVSYPEEV
jgi:hypothetical protein